MNPDPDLHRFDDDGGGHHAHPSTRTGEVLSVEDTERGVIIPAKMDPDPFNDDGRADEVVILTEMPVTLKDLVDRIFEINTAKGWVGDNRTVGDDISLMHSELSEMLEEHRSGITPTQIYFSRGDNKTDPIELDSDTWHDLEYSPEFDGKPEGFAVEAADLLIRLADNVRRRIGLQNFERALEFKLQYNATRPYRHGGKVI